MTKPKAEFQRDKFLLRMLATIFVVQACVFVYGFALCMNGGGLRNCPDVGRRYDQTFGVMVATTLALLTGAQLTKSSKDPVEPKNDSTELPPKTGK